MCIRDRVLENSGTEYDVVGDPGCPVDPTPGCDFDPYDPNAIPPVPANDVIKSGDQACYRITVAYNDLGEGPAAQNPVLTLPFAETGIVWEEIPANCATPPSVLNGDGLTTPSELVCHLNSDINAGQSFQFLFCAEVLFNVNDGDTFTTGVEASSDNTNTANGVDIDLNATVGPPRLNLKKRSAGHTPFTCNGVDGVRMRFTKRIEMFPEHIGSSPPDPTIPLTWTDNMSNLGAGAFILGCDTDPANLAADFLASPPAGCDNEMGTPPSSTAISAAYPQQMVRDTPLSLIHI